MLMHEFRFQLFPLLLLVVLNFLQITYKNAHSVHYRTPPEVRHVNDSYRSPLDEAFDYYYSNEEADVQDDFASDIVDPFGASVLTALSGTNLTSTCQCMEKFAIALRIAVQSPNNVERFNGVCDHYNTTVECMRTVNPTCSNQEPFDVITSGIYYMCIEQRGAFDAVMECIDSEMISVQKECEMTCHTKERMAHWAIQSGMLDNIMENLLGSLTNGETLAMQLFGRQNSIGQTKVLADDTQNNPFVDVAKRVASAAEQKWTPKGTMVDRGFNQLFSLPSGKAAAVPSSFQRNLSPEFLKAAVQDGCDLTRCQLTCFKMKFDARCGGSAGTLLSEAFVRPIGESQRLIGLGTMTQVIGAFMPVTCDFLFRSNVLREFRIPKELDDALKAKYSRSANNTVDGNVMSPTEQKLPENDSIAELASPPEKPAEGVNSSAKVPQKPKVFPIVSDEEDEDDAQLPTVVAQD